MKLLAGTIKRASKGYSIYLDTQFVLALLVCIYYQPMYALGFILIVYAFYTVTPLRYKVYWHRILEQSYLRRMFKLNRDNMFIGTFALMLFLITFFVTFVYTGLTQDAYLALNKYITGLSIPLSCLLYASPGYIRYMLGTLASTTELYSMYVMSVSNYLGIISSYHIFNYAGCGNILRNVVGNAELVAQHAENVLNKLPMYLLFNLSITLFLFSILTYVIDVSMSLYKKKGKF